MATESSLSSRPEEPAPVAEHQSEGLDDAKGKGHPQLRHWMSWILPLLAIGLPLVGFVVVASIPGAKLAFGGGTRSLGRGDFLIPVLILCLEAIRCWWAEVECGTMLAASRVFLSAACLFAVVIALYAFAVAANTSVTADSTKSIIVITAACFTTGLVSGTIAVAMSRPRASKADSE
jgi:hypothetical protein